VTNTPCAQLTNAPRSMIGLDRQLLGLLELGLMEDTATAAADSRRQHPMSVVDSVSKRSRSTNRNARSLN
jgi:hypothetical protein